VAEGSDEPRRSANTRSRSAVGDPDVVLTNTYDVDIAGRLGERRRPGLLPGKAGRSRSRRAARRGGVRRPSTTGGRLRGNQCRGSAEEHLLCSAGRADAAQPHESHARSMRRNSRRRIRDRPLEDPIFPAETARTARPAGRDRLRRPAAFPFNVRPPTNGASPRRTEAGRMGDGGVRGQKLAPSG